MSINFFKNSANIIGHEAVDKFLRLLGFFVTIIGVIIAFTPIFEGPLISTHLFYSYLGFSVIPIGWFLFLLGHKNDRLYKRRLVDRGEIKTLLSEFNKYNEDDNYIVDIDSENDYTELEVLPIRFILVDIYPIELLITKTEYELNILLKDYVDGESFDSNYYKSWKTKIEKLIENLTKGGEREENYEQSLRAELKTLRETVAQYDKSWAEGEQYRDGVVYWGIVAVLSFIFIGLIPLIHPEGSKLLTYFHWILFGVAGGLSSRLFAIHGEDIAEIGETQGKQLLKQMAISTITGAIASLLLYGILLGGIIKGPIFPNFPIKLEDANYLSNTGLSVFWGIFSGLSLRVLSSLIKLGESAIGSNVEN